MRHLLKIISVLGLLAVKAVSAQSANVQWQSIAQLAGHDDAHYSNVPPGLSGAFVGVHNEALIIAGGVRPRSTKTGLTQGFEYFDQIWVATAKERSPLDSGNGPAERTELSWYPIQSRLSQALANGAAVNHELGVITIAGSDGQAAYQNVQMLRWHKQQKRLETFTLPSLPFAINNPSAALIKDTLYVIGTSVSEPAQSAFLALDLSELKLDFAGNPMVSDGVVQFKASASPPATQSYWRQLPSQPIDRVHSSNAATRLILMAQYDGRADRLYVLSASRAKQASGQGVSAEYHWHIDRDLWTYRVGDANVKAGWSRLANVPVATSDSYRGYHTAVAFGASHILLLPLPPSDSNQSLPALFYNTITDTWTADGQSDVNSASLPVVESRSANVAMTTPAYWGQDLVVMTSSQQAAGQANNIWGIQVNSSVPVFGWQNMVVLTLYLLAVVMVGVYFMFKNRSTDDYFRGGQDIPWWAAACSIYATMLSSLTYVALPALVYRTDWLLYVGVMMIVVVAPIAIYVAMPFFRQIDATSAYEYLSKRFNMPVRLFASGLFMLFHIGRMGIVMALTALALAAVTPLNAQQCVLIMGGLCLIYCTLGGVEAVIWTDTIQTLVLLLGAVLCFVYILSGIDGGFAGFIEQGLAADKFKMAHVDFSLDSITVLSIWVIVLGGIGQNISSYTADQAVVQRYMVTTDTKAAANSIWANAFMAIPGALLFFCIGTGLYCFYQSQPQKLDPTIQIDQIFPAFIATELPIGIAGLIVAGIFAAAQSTVSTSMNSIATTFVTDFMRPFSVCKSDQAYLKAAQLLTFLMGALGTCAALIFISPEIRSLMEQYFMVIGMFMGALGGLFVLGVVTRRANGWGAMIGLFTGVALMFSAWRMQWADGYLFATIGILTCLLVGYLMSLVLPARDHDLTGLTLYTMRK